MSTLTPEEIEALAAAFGIGPYSGKEFADALRAKWFAEPIGQATWGLKGAKQPFAEPVIATNPEYWKQHDTYAWVPVYAAPQEEK